VKGKWQYTIERMPLRAMATEWELITLTADSKIEQPCMKNMGCFNLYNNINLVVLFGGGNAG